MANEIVSSDRVWERAGPQPCNAAIVFGLTATLSAAGLLRVHICRPGSRKPGTRGNFTQKLICGLWHAIYTLGGQTAWFINVKSPSPCRNKVFGMRNTASSYQKLEDAVDVTHSLQTPILAILLLVYICRKYIFSTTKKI